MKRMAMDLNIAEDSVELANHIKSSGYLWLALAKMNIAGRNKMEKVQVDVDSRMLRLPTEEMVPVLVEKLYSSLTGLIEDEIVRMRDAANLDTIWEWLSMIYASIDSTYWLYLSIRMNKASYYHVIIVFIHLGELYKYTLWFDIIK